MRCFIAIDIGDNIKKALAVLQNQLADKAGIEKGDVRWVRPEAMHLTLKFLGEVKDNRIAEICNIVQEVAGCHKNFDLDIESVDCFGGKRARILWVGTHDGGSELKRLQKDIEDQLALAGWPKENRAFAGHLTLCRIKKPIAGMKLSQIAEDYNNYIIGTVAIDSVIVYQSQLHQTGPVYTRLGNYKLKQN